MSQCLFISTCSGACLPKQKAELSISCLVYKVVFIDVPLILLSLLRNATCFWSGDPALAVTTWSPRGHGLLSAPVRWKMRSTFPPWTSFRKSVPHLIVSWKASGNLCSSAGATTAEYVCSFTLRAFSSRKCVSQLSYNFLNCRVSLSLKTCGKLNRSFTCALWMAVSFPYRFFETSTAAV